MDECWMKLWVDEDLRGGMDEKGRGRRRQDAAKASGRIINAIWPFCASLGLT